MSDTPDTPPLGLADYPLAENRPDLVRTTRGLPLEAVTVEAVVAGDLTLADLAITPDALRHQATIAQAASRPTLAQNFARAAAMVPIPAELILSVYEKLRPGRVKDKATLLAVAAELRRDYGAETLAAFVEQAAEVYERRGVFGFRF